MENRIRCVATLLHEGIGRNINSTRNDRAIGTDGLEMKRNNVFRNLTYPVTLLSASILVVVSIVGIVNTLGQAGWQAAIFKIIGEPDVLQTTILASIVECAADCGTGDSVTLEIKGEQFLDLVAPGSPTVLLGGMDITGDIISSTVAHIEAVLSAYDFPPGNYLLSVQRAGEESVKRVDTLNVTAGARRPAAPHRRWWAERLSSIFSTRSASTPG